MTNSNCAQDFNFTGLITLTMQCSYFFLLSLILWSSFLETEAICDWIGCARNCDYNCPPCNCHNYECPSCPQSACPDCNCPTLPKDLYGIKNDVQQTKEYAKNLEKEISKTNDQIQDITLNNCNMHDQIKETVDNLTHQNEELHHKMWETDPYGIKDYAQQTKEYMKNLTRQNEELHHKIKNILRQNEELRHKLWETALAMWIVISLLILVVLLGGIIIFRLFYPSGKNIQRQIKENKNIPDRQTADESVSPVSSAAHNSNRHKWTFNPTYFTRNIFGSVRSMASNIYDTITSYDFGRRPSIRSYFRNAKDAIETQGLLDSDSDEMPENENPAFEEEQKDPDYPRAMMTEITVYDTENTKEEQIQKSCQDPPYNFTSFKVYDETQKDSYPNDPHDKTRERMEDCHSASKTTRADSHDENWQHVSWKDYGNSPSTSDSAAGPRNTPNDDDYSLITPEKSSADKSSDEIIERVCTEVNSEEECRSESENWFSVEYRDYSDTETNSVVFESDGNRVNENFGTMQDIDTSGLPTMPVPSVLLPMDETSSADTVSVNQYESIDDGEESVHSMFHGKGDFPLINDEPVNEIATNDELEGGNNNQLSQSLIEGEVKNKLQGNSSTTVGLDFTNFAESRSAEFENKLQLKEEVDLLLKGTQGFTESVKSQGKDDIRITMEEEYNEIQDNGTPGPSVQSGPSFTQSPEYPSIDNNEHDLSDPGAADMSGIPNAQNKKLDQPDNQSTSDPYLVLEEDPEKSNVSIFDRNDTADVDGEITDVDNSFGSSGAHYEKLNKLDQNPPYAELFPPNMQDILKELPDTADNILNFSRAEMERGGELDDDYTGDGYDDDISGYL